MEIKQTVLETRHGQMFYTGVKSVISVREQNTRVNPLTALLNCFPINICTTVLPA